MLKKSRKFFCFFFFIYACYDCLDKDLLCRLGGYLYYQFVLLKLLADHQLDKDWQIGGTLVIPFGPRKMGFIKKRKEKRVVGCAYCLRFG